MTPAAPLPDPIIVCEDVSVAYGREEVLHDVSLRIPRGAFVPFVGPIGAGKTTLLRAILGLLKPRRGRIVTPFGRAPPGYVPQQKAIDPLYPLSALQIAAMGLYPANGWFGRPSDAQRAAVREALERLDLWPHRHKRYAELSGGMKQKALIARAFVSGADVFVLDEPTSELDQESEQEVLAHLLRLSREEGKTVLLAHHGLNAVAQEARLVCLVNHGRALLASLEELGLPPGPSRHGPSLPEGRRRAEP